MGGRTREQVQGDLTAAGLPADTAAALAAGAGLRGQDAGNFATTQRDAVRLTDDQQQALMTVAVAPAQRAVANAVTVPLNQNQYDALTSLAYNIGTGAFQRSTLLRRLNAGDYPGAAEQFGVWVRSGGADSPGLIARRAAERRLFEFPVGTEGAVP
jgi:GH24 family phage-related lysozyme (muramidase)